MNTTNSLGIEAHLEERFPTNVVLSLVSGAEITQLGASEFEHSGSTQIWVGPANKNPSIPASIQNDMAEALAMTLTTGQVDCKVSSNIRQQQYERMMGYASLLIFSSSRLIVIVRPIAFHPLSVLFETPSHVELLEKIGVRAMISDIIEELMQIAVAQGCSFPPDYTETTIESMLKPTEMNTIMYQDFLAKRPMEIETYLGSPIRLAQAVNVRVPRIETLYSILHNFNTLNQSRPPPPSGSPVSAAPNSARGPPPRMGSGSYPRPGMNGMPNGMPNGGPRSRAPSMGGVPPRRGPPPVNGYGPRGPGGYPRGPPSNQISRRPSFENGDLGEEFSHLALIDDIPEGDVAGGFGMGMGPMGGPVADIELRERELALRQREIQLREREMNMGRGPRRPPPTRGGFDDDDDEDDDYFDPTIPRGPIPQIDPDNFDMMSVTSKRNRKAPSASQLRKNPEGMNGGGGGGGFRIGGGMRPTYARNRSSQQLMADVPGVGESIMSNPLMGYSSNRYGNVDRKQIADESRLGSLTRERLDQLAGASMNGMNGAYPTPPGAGPPGAGPRRTSLSPGDSFGPGRRTSGRPSPPGQGYGADGMLGTRPSPPGMMRQPVPRYPPGQGNAVAPQQVEQYAGVSKQYPYKSSPQVVRSLTGSASASAGSGESAQIDSENSAHSSQSSFGPRPPIGVVR